MGNYVKRRGKIKAVWLWTSWKQGRLCHSTGNNWAIEKLWFLVGRSVSYLSIVFWMALIQVLCAG